MRLSKNEILLGVATIHQLSVENMVCPKFAHSKDEMEKRIFNIVKVNQELKLAVNRELLTRFISKVGKSNNLNLDAFSQDIVGDYVSKSVSSDFMNFLKARGLTLDDLVESNTMFH